MREGVDGSILVAVGAPGDNLSAGTTFLFRRSTLGTLFSWNLEPMLPRPGGTLGDYFGGALAIAPDLTQVAIAAPFDNPTGCRHAPARASVDPRRHRARGEADRTNRQ